MQRLTYLKWNSRCFSQLTQPNLSPSTKILIAIEVLTVLRPPILFQQANPVMEVECNRVFGKNQVIVGELTLDMV